MVGGKPRWANQTDSGQNNLAPSDDRWLIRSQTYPGIAAAMGGSARVDYQRGYPVTMNHPEATVHAAEVARQVAGDVDLEMLPLMAGEDFSYMLNERPGCYLFIGQGDTASVHHPAYDFNDAISPIGASFLARLVERAQPVAR